MKRILPFLLVMLLTFSLANAQDEAEAPSPLMRALAIVPLTEEVMAVAPIFSYADYHAAIISRVGEVPEDFTAFMEGFDSQDPLAATLIFSLPRSGPTDLTSYFMQMVDLPSVLGFDFFDIAQGLETARSDHRITAFFGEFSPETISATMQANGFVIEEEADDEVVLCGEEFGCDGGMQVNFSTRNFANIFGGALGRRLPTLATRDRVAAAMTLPLFEGMRAAMDGDQTSLADLGAVQAIDAWLNQFPYVISVQGMTAEPALTLDIASLIGEVDDPAAVLAELQAALAENPLPLFEMMAVTGVATDDTEIGMVVLVFASAADAELAAESLPVRLQNLESPRQRGSTYAEVFAVAGRLTVSAPYRVETTEGERYVVSVQIEDEKPGLPVGRERPVESLRGMERILRGLNMRDTLWLTPTP